MKKFGATLSILIMILLTLTSCKQPTNNDADYNDLMDDIKRNEPLITDDISSEEALQVTDFGLTLFKNSLSEEGENTLVSPISVLYALGMTANGAGGKTLEEMEGAFGLSIDQLKDFAYLFEKSMDNNDEVSVKIANSLWINDKEGFNVKEDFLQVNKDYYNSSIFFSPFSEATVDDINSWVNENTDGMIEDIIEKVPPEAVMYLINALAFDAQWQELYSEDQIRQGIFTTENATNQEVDFMDSDEYFYIEGDNEIGLMKDYKNGSYSFVALLPKEGLSMEDYIQTLTGEEIQSLIENVEETEVMASIPKFESEYEIVLNEALMDMGINQAFDLNEADFSRMASNDYPFGISEVRHKTYIDVSEKGTKAGAATSVEMVESAMPIEDQVKYVYLDRPFVYMIYDNNNKLPLFIGTLVEI